MVWIILRRSLAVLLILLFIPLFLLILTGTRITSAFLDPGFYIEQLRKADMYNFLYGDWVAAEVDKELRKADDPPLSKLISGKEAVARLKRIAPPAWVQEQAEGVITPVVPYVAGREDSFSFTVPLADRADAGLAELRDFLGEVDTYNFVFDEIITPAVQDSVRDVRELPFGLRVTDQQIVDDVRQVFPQQWVQAQVGNVIDTVGPYITGRTDSFTLTVPLADRADVALGVVQRLLRQAKVRDFVFDQVIAPGVRKSVGQAVSLPFGVEVTPQEIIDALGQVVTDQWVQAQVDKLVQTAGPYIIGRTDHFTLVVELADRKQAAVGVVENLVDRKLRALFDRLPSCTPAQLAELLRRGPTGALPACKPPGVTYEQLKRDLNIDVAGQVARLVAEPLPTSFTLTDADLRSLLSQQGNADAVKLLDDVRTTLRSGWTFTDADLRRYLTEQEGGEAVQRLDDVRKVLRDGWTFTDADLRRQIAKQEDGEDALEGLDQFREQMGRINSFMVVAFLVLALLPVGIGFIGGRGWWGRLRWASVAFAVASLVTMVAAMVAQAQLTANIAEIIPPSEDVPLVVVEKGRDLFSNVVESVVGGIEGQARWYLIIGLVALVASVVAPILVRRRAAAPPPKS